MKLLIPGKQIYKRDIGSWPRTGFIIEQNLNSRTRALIVPKGPPCPHR